MLQAYRQHVAERAALGIPPLPLSAKQTGELIELLKAPPAGEEAALVELITHRVPAGVDDAAKVKASYLAAVGVHTGAMILAAGAVALIIYYKVGLQILRRSWLNLDQVWAVAMVVSGVLALLL